MMAVGGGPVGGEGAKKGNGKTVAIVLAVVLILIVAGVSLVVLTSRKAAPSEIRIGTLYASSGSFALSSGYQLSGLRLWINQTNAAGGLYVSSYGKKLPLKLFTYDDQSSTSTAATDYANLITVDHVNVFVSDFGSTLTAPAVSIAQEHHVLLFDPTASSPGFFSASDPYIVDLSILVSSEWPLVLAHYLITHRTAISRIAILYLDQAFTAAQAATLDSALTAVGITPVYYQPTSASSSAEYSTILQSINSTNPQAVIELGYDLNDIAFFSAISAGNYHFPFVFTIYPGLEYSVLLADTPPGSLNYTYTYASPPVVQYTNVTLGPTTSQFVTQWTSLYGHAPNFNNIAGYNAGLLIGKIISTAGNLNQLDMRKAANMLSGNVTTLEGPFVLNTSTGAQLGMPMDVLQFQPSSSGLVPVVIYPENVATGTAIYPAPSVMLASPESSGAGSAYFWQSDLSVPAAASMVSPNSIFSAAAYMDGERL
ncbi:MAG: ABC transporter substrate-binding protein [Thermoplasmata archaeon YP2-bin.285]|uniref:ABC transporter substrate-binding protein n=1 Tax=Candidatus Sysuiplasma superficiale TaxID=2823368 RepID=A0A8J7YKG6_9ARCH|nr:ABC transporter substrate-binding protein [Candidatus Sysuiplasma superficiale]